MECGCECMCIAQGHITPAWLFRVRSCWQVTAARMSVVLVSRDGAASRWPGKPVVNVTADVGGIGPTRDNGQAVLTHFAHWGVTSGSSPHWQNLGLSPYGWTQVLFVMHKNKQLWMAFFQTADGKVHTTTWMLYAQGKFVLARQWITRQMWSPHWHS